MTTTITGTIVNLVLHPSEYGCSQVVHQHLPDIIYASRVACTSLVLFIIMILLVEDYEYNNIVLHSTL